jgi:tetraacyldisaccharide 4'-kinase
MNANNLSESDTRAARIIGSALTPNTESDYNTIPGHGSPGTEGWGNVVRDNVLSLIRGERRGLLAGMQRGGLWLLSLPYGLAVGTRNRFYDWGWRKIHRVNVPVISVGNLTVGGTGKTPCVEYVARWYREQELRVAILSRGYGSEAGRNDEALVLEENLPDVPHLQGADRAALARIAEEELESEVLVLDDAFQHRRLARNLDLVLIDATNPWGYGHLLPRGLLREPLSGLKRAGALVMTRCDQVAPEELERLRDRVAGIAPGKPVIESIHQPADLVNADQATADLDQLRGRPVAAFCGIGNPEAFRNTLIGLGAEVRAFRAFADHHLYTRADIDELRRWVRQQAMDCVVVTTQKDLVKIRLTQLGERPLHALRIQLHLTRNRELLGQQLKEALA